MYNRQKVIYFILVIINVIVISSLFFYDKINLIKANSEDYTLALKDIDFKTTDCFTSKKKTEVIYKCGRNHHLVPDFNIDNFMKHTDPFLQMYFKRLDQFTTDGAINNRFALWTFLKLFQPDHVIESGANKGYGTWLIRNALPKARITVVSPSTPNKYYDKALDTKYYTGKAFKDFDKIKWSKENVNFKKTILYFDDHQSVYKRIKQAAKYGFKHIIFDDNYLPGSTNGSNNNLSLRQACDAAGCLTKISPQFLTNRYVDNFGKLNRTFELNSKFRIDMGIELDKLIKIIYEPPLLCDVLEYPLSAQEKVTHRWFRNLVNPLLTTKQCVNIQRNLKLLTRSFTKYANVVYVGL